MENLPSIFCLLLLLILRNAYGDLKNDDIIPGIDASKIDLHRDDLNMQSSRREPIKKMNPVDDFKKDSCFDLKPGKDILITSSPSSKFTTFCYHGEQRYVSTLLKTVEVILDIPNDNFYYYQGRNASEVKFYYNEASWFSFSPWKPRTFRLSLYNTSCIGFDTSNAYKVALRVRWIDLWRVMMLVIGIALFCMAPILAQNIFFHYATGISMGVFGSLLIVVYIMARYIPKKTGAATILIGGWGLILYVAQYMWQNCLSLLKEYQNVAIGYVAIAGILSFCVVYRYGPVTDQRSLQLVQWSLQLSSLVIVFFSSQFREATLSIVILLLSYYNMPSYVVTRFKTLWYKRFPPKVKLLSEDEYLEQAKVETEKALKDLRVFCQSPKCNTWKTVSRISSPQRYEEFYAKPKHQSRKATRPQSRFAEFIEGGSHLSDEELMSYQTELEFTRRSNEDDDLFSEDDD